jgi:hypothetical protein
MFEGKPILVYDVETDSLDLDKAKIKWFGAYSYLDNQYYEIPFKGNEKDVKQLIARHKILVGFNNKEFDNPIIVNNFNDETIFSYKVLLDFLEISAPKGGKEYGKFRKNKLAQMGIKLKNFSLKSIIEKLKLQAAEVKQEKMDVVKKQDYEQAANLRDKEKKILDKLILEKKKFEEELKTIENDIHQTKNMSVQDPINYGIKINNRLAHLMMEQAQGDYRPTKQGEEVREKISKLVDEELVKLKNCVDSNLLRINQMAKEKGVVFVN